MQHSDVLTLSPQAGEKQEIPRTFLQQGSWEFARPGRAHLVGIAGAGLRSLADVLLGWGWKLSGSDLTGETLAHLAARGVCVHRGHAAEHVPVDAELVVYSDAVSADNPELARARQAGAPVLSYFQAVGQMMAQKRGVAVAGTHGKSTTTAMLAHLLVSAGQDPTVVYGASLLGRQSGGRAGRGPWVLAEACEYRANFHHLRAEQAAILGIEPDHFDCYPSWDSLLDAFAQLARQIPDHGLLLARHECGATRQVTAGLRCRVETFGFDAKADWSARLLAEEHGRYRFEVVHHGRPLCGLGLSVAGRHNVVNALAAAALAWHHGLSPEPIAAGLEAFPGLHRRLETLGQWRGVCLLDDYAHHPTEVRATLATVRAMAPGRRVWCVFQPHQASRTAHLLGELAASLQNADKLMIGEIFRAREPEFRRGEVTAADLAREVRRLGADVAEEHVLESIVRILKAQLKAGDVLITIGAGDIRKLHEHWRG